MPGSVDTVIPRELRHESRHKLGLDRHRGELRLEARIA